MKQSLFGSLIASLLLVNAVVACSSPVSTAISAASAVASALPKAPGAVASALPSALPSAAAAVQSAVGTFTFVGIDADKVATSGDVDADGSKDGHFMASLTLPNPTEIKSIRVEGLTADKKEPTGESCSTGDSTSYNLAVVNNAGKTVNLKMGYPSTLGSFATDDKNMLSLDLYCHNNGNFVANSMYRLTLKLGSGLTLTKETKIQ